MKKYMFALCTMCVLFSSCSKDITPDDPTKFSTKSIVGTWVAIGNNNEVLYYYDIKSDSHLLYVDPAHTGGQATNSSADGCMHITKDMEWKQKGDIEYTFDEDKQVIRCTSGTLSGFKVEYIVGLLGSDEIFAVKRVGIDEGWIYDKTGWLKDAHVYRIKGIKEDL